MNISLNFDDTYTKDPAFWNGLCRSATLNVVKGNLCNSQKERQIWLRIKLSVAAYAYEFESESIMSDADFDRLSYEVDPLIKTSRRKLDLFFMNKFQPCTGMWIREHPELNAIKDIYNKYYK